MNDESNNQPNNTESQGVASWRVDQQPFVENVQVFGFLQMCADRRFHRIIQQEFKSDVGLTEREDYWIHADAGGTPKMADLTIAPNYCYGKKKVRMMGWSAHGDGCGGFGEEVPDDVIQRDLCLTMQKNIARYPEATHFIYFVTIKEGQTVIYKRIVNPGESISCD